MPPGAQRLIESDPALKQKITDAMSGKGSPSDAQQAVTAATMIEANPDQFSAEDIETLFSIEEVAAGSNVSGAPESAETLRKMLEAVRRGRKASSVTSAAGGTGPAGQRRAPASAPQKEPAAGGSKSDVQTPQQQPSGADVAAAVANVTGARRRVLDALLGKAGLPAAPVIDELIAVLPADLTDVEATQLIANLSNVTAESAQEVLLSVRAGVAVLRDTHGAKPGGLTDDETAILAAAAKIAPATLTKGRIMAPIPGEAKIGRPMACSCLAVWILGSPTPAWQRCASTRSQAGA